MFGEKGVIEKLLLGRVNQFAVGEIHPQAVCYSNGPENLLLLDGNGRLGQPFFDLMQTLQGVFVVTGHSKSGHSLTEWGFFI